jgi:endonuclease/exonuclease/phosphatase family metal-dependent hydrolase
MTRWCNHKAVQHSVACWIRDEWTRYGSSTQPSPIYTFWDYMRKRWERDAGLRIDHLLLNPELTRRLVSAGVNRAVRGRAGASDHAPTWIEVQRMKDAAGLSAAARNALVDDKPHNGSSKVTVFFM